MTTGKEITDLAKAKKDVNQVIVIDDSSHDGRCDL